MAVEDEKREPESLDIYQSQDSNEDQLTLSQSSQHFYTRKKPSGRKAKLLRVKHIYSAPPASLSSLDHLQIVADEPESNRSHCKRKRASNDRFQASHQQYSSVMERAMEVQSNLGPRIPSFLKLMLRSHVTHGFWLGLPTGFCKLNLPKQDCCITLVDEHGKEHETKYLAEKSGLSAGWRGFSIEHNLVEGDAVVFQLTEATKFKVYIIRANNLAEVDGALSLLNLDPIPVQVAGGNNGKDSPPESVSNTGSAAGEQFENDSEEAGSDVVDGIRLASAALEFGDVKIFENFTIIVNGLIIDSELLQHVRLKYYELCCSQKGFLHDHLLEGINCKLVTGIISEIVNVADAMRACNLTTTSLKDLESWDKSLKAFEQLGMNVGFLRARLHRILSLTKSEEAMDTKMYNEARIRRASLEEEMKNLEMKLMELKVAHANYDKKIERLKLKAEIYETKFQSEVQAPW